MFFYRNCNSLYSRTQTEAKTLLWRLCKSTWIIPTRQSSLFHHLAEEEEKEEEDQSLKLALGQPWVRRVSDFNFLVSAYEGGGQSSPSPSHLPTDSVRSMNSS